MNFSDLPKDFVTSVDYVVYHKNCADGIGAAWPFWRENFDRHAKGEIIIEGMVHGQTPPDVKGKNLVVVDFCFPREEVIKLAKHAKRIVILDHHISAQKDLEGPLPKNVFTIFDINRSGAQIAWDFVYVGHPTPWFIDVIAARDLWKWTKPNHKDLSNVLYKNGYYTWEKLEEMFAGSQTQADEDLLIKKFMAMTGTKEDEEIEKEIVATCKRAILTEMTTPKGDVYRVRLVSCTSPKLRSEVGNRLSEDCDFAVTWQYDFLLDEWWCSARASATSGIDLSIIAGQFGGGGHEKASGFTIKNGKTLHSYFRTIEVPANRESDSASVNISKK